ncbi:MAG: CPBP family intramembrane glutamic endopeptidase [Thermoguttaceae bacterium]
MGTMNFAVAAALFEGALAVLAVSLGWVLGRPPMATFRLSAIDLGWGIVATVPLLAVFWLCAKAPWRPFVRIMQVLDETFIPLFRQCGMLELAVIAVLAGMGEEMLFRGIIQSWVADKVGGPYGVGIGLAAAAAIFGLLHGVTPTYALLAGVIGLYLGAIWLATGNLLVPIASHALYDFLAFVYLVRVRKSKAISQGGEDERED